MNEYLISNFHSFLISKNLGYNPFLQVLPKINNRITYPKSDADNTENEIRCPICLRLAWTPVHPNCCIHVFCKDCIEKWAQTKLICPICRQSFDYIKKVNFDKTFYEFQGNLFAY